MSETPENTGAPTGITLAEATKACVTADLNGEEHYPAAAWLIVDQQARGMDVPIDVLITKALSQHTENIGVQHC